MIFWRTFNNKVYPVQEVENLGFSLNDPSFIPNEYLDSRHFIILRTCFGYGDWGIISAFPKKLKEKYPDCKVYLPSPHLLRTMFGHLEKNWSSWEDPFQVVNKVFDNNPFVDGLVDEFEGEVFNDHFRIYDGDKDEPLMKQVLRFWQFHNFENIDPDLYWSKEEQILGDRIIQEHVGDTPFCSLLISNRYEGEGRSKIQKILDKNKLPVFYWTASSNHGFNFIPALDMRHIDIRIQMYIKSKAQFNIGNQTGVNNTIAPYSPTYTVPRGKLGSNFIEKEIYI